MGLDSRSAVESKAFVATKTATEGAKSISTQLPVAKPATAKAKTVPGETAALAELAAAVASKLAELPAVQPTKTAELAKLAGLTKLAAAHTHLATLERATGTTQHVTGGDGYHREWPARPVGPDHGSRNVGAEGIVDAAGSATLGSPSHATSAHLATKTSHAHLATAELAHLAKLATIEAELATAKLAATLHAVVTDLATADLAALATSGSIPGGINRLAGLGARTSLRHQGRQGAPEQSASQEELFPVIHGCLRVDRTAQDAECALNRRTEGSARLASIHERIF